MQYKHALLGVGLTFTLVTPALSEEFTGDTKLACEAIICLSTGQPPNQCAASLAKYFSISFKKFSDTLKGRINFLNLCPTSSAEGIPQLINDIANGAGSCDPDTLNSSLLSGDPFNGEATYISNILPGVCASYNSNPLVRLNLIYQGDPNNGGKWAFGN